MRFFKESIPNLLEVSIGQAFVSDALYFGLYNTMQLYLRELKWFSIFALLKAKFVFFFTKKNERFINNDKSLI